MCEILVWFECVQVNRSKKLCLQCQSDSFIVAVLTSTLSAVTISGTL